MTEHQLSNAGLRVHWFVSSNCLGQLPRRADRQHSQYCSCPFQQMSNPDANYGLTQMEKLKEHCRNNDPTYLQ